MRTNSSYDELGPMFVQLSTPEGRAVWVRPAMIFGFTHPYDWKNQGIFVRRLLVPGVVDDPIVFLDTPENLRKLGF